jgi:hypothetical protein
MTLQQLKYTLNRECGSIARRPTAYIPRRVFPIRRELEKEWA